MPWSEKQNHLFRAIEHGWRPPASSGIHIKRGDATRMAHEGIRRAQGGLVLYDDYVPPKRGSPRDTAGGGTRAYADGGPVDDRVPLYAMQPQPAMAPAIGNIPLTTIEQMRPLGMAAGGAVDFTKFDRRTADLMRLNQRIRQSTDLSGSQDATRGILDRLTLRRGPGLSAFAPSGMASSMGLGRYPLPDMAGSMPGYAKGGSVPRNKRTIDMLEDGRVVVRHSFYGRTPAEASHMLSAHRRADRSLDDALRGKPYKGVNITARRLASGGYAGGGYADGGETDGNFVQRHPFLTGAAASLAALRPRYINRLARPFSRALARPMFSAESVSDTAMPAALQRRRFDLARSGSAHEYKDLPIHDLQGAWQGDKGMEYNRLFAQEYPRSLGRVRDDPFGLAYAGQMGENLEQQAVPVNRFVPHLWNTDEDANAMMVHGVDDEKLRRLADIMGPDVVTSHRPGNKALVFPLGDQRISDLATEANAGLGFPKIRYGRSDPGKDRVLLTRKPWGDLTYGEAGADPRDDRYAMFERAALK